MHRQLGHGLVTVAVVKRLKKVSVWTVRRDKKRGRSQDGRWWGFDYI